MIKNSDITIIVQGPYYKNITDLVLKNIYRIFKGSKLIFSTYKNDELNNSLKNKFNLIINKTPAKTPMSFEPIRFYNYCGQIRTTLSGLKNVKTNYCLKTRSDVIINNRNFLKYYNKFKKTNQDFKILEEKVIISSFNTIDPRKYPLPFHFSDWFYFGKKNDLLKIFNQNYKSRENNEVPLWFLNRKKPKYFFNDYFSKYRTEQHIAKNFLKKFINLKFNHGYDYNLKNIELTEKILSSNYLVLDMKQISLKSLKNPHIENSTNLIYFNERINFHKWLKLYKKYCDPNILIPSIKFNELLKTLIWLILHPKEAISRFLFFNKIKQ